MILATRIRIYPDEAQARFLNAQFGAIRYVWNRAFAAKRHYYKVRSQSLSPRMDLKPLLSRAKKSPRYAWLRDYDSMALQQSVLNLERAYVNFFEKRAGFPRFKSRNGRQSSHHCTGRLDVIEGGILIPKLKRPIRAVVHRAIAGRIKSITISRERSGKFYAAVLHEDDAVAPPLAERVTPDRVLGIDLGLIDVVTTSTGLKVPNPRFLRRSAHAVRKAQRALSRKKKGSKNRAKARIRVARAHERLANARTDFQHKLSAMIVRESQGAISIETLSVRNMMKNRKLARAISDVGWSGFVGKLGYKAERAGIRLLRVGRWEPTTKLCSCCGAGSGPLTLSVRAWTCEGCGSSHDRDINAAINIAAAGARQLPACGTLVEVS